MTIENLNEAPREVQDALNNMDNKPTETTENVSANLDDPEFDFTQLEGFDGLPEDLKPSDPKPVEEPPKPDDVTKDNPDQIGRRIQSLEERILSLTEQLQKNMPKPSEPEPTYTPPTKSELWEKMNSIEPCPVELITTPEDMVASQEWYSRVQGKMAQQYVNDYLSHAEQLKQLAGDKHEQVIFLIKAPNSPFNKKYSDDGKIDSDKNYKAALRALNDKETKEKAKFGQSDNPTGKAPTIPKTVDNTTTTTAKLTPQAQEYADYLKLTQDDINESSKRFIPIGK